MGRQRISAFATALAFSITVTAFGLVASLNTAEARGPRAKRVEIKPCDGDFSLQVKVRPVEGDAAETEDGIMGFKLDYKAKESRGIASSLRTGQSSSFDRKTCEKWQKAQWDRLARIEFDSDRARRKTVACRNVASIDFKAPSASKHLQVCLAGAKSDYVTYAFQLFYDGGDFLIAK